MKPWEKTYINLPVIYVDDFIFIFILNNNLFIFILFELMLTFL